MNVVDGRTLSHEALETIRLAALRRVRSGERPSDVIKGYGFCRTTIYKWIRAAGRGGEKALRSRKGTGRPCKLSDRQKQQVRQWICGKDPRQYGFEYGLWTRAIVSEMVRDRFKVKLSVASVGRVLAELQITPQKPLRRAYERDPKAVERWKRKEYPRIRKRARRLGAEIFFLDETGIRSDDPLGRSWGRRGETPVVPTSGQRQAVNAMSAVNPRGAFWYAVYTGRLNAARFVEFLKDFMRRRRTRVFLIVDSHPTHKAKIVKAYVKSQRGRLELYFLPPYAPDLNPDEFVWNHVKEHGLAKRPLRQNESLKERVVQDLVSIAANSELVRSFFCAPSVAYIMN